MSVGMVCSQASAAAASCLLQASYWPRTFLSQKEAELSPGCQAERSISSERFITCCAIKSTRPDFSA